MTVEIATMKLVYSIGGSTVSIDRNLSRPYSLLSPIKLVLDVNTLGGGDVVQPLDGSLPHESSCGLV